MVLAMLPATFARCDSKLRLGVGDAFASDPAAKIQKRLDLYKQAGIGIIRVDVEWRSLERAEGIWEDPGNLALLKLAKQNGFRLKANVGSIQGPPAWFLKRFPDARMINQDGVTSPDDMSYWYPGLHALLENKDEQLFAYLARSGLLTGISYLVVPLGPGGEPLYPAQFTPMRFWFYDTYAQADFPRQMRAKYAALRIANAVWGTDYRDWSDVRIPRPATQPGAMWRDVLEWYRDAKRQFIRWQLGHYQALVKKYYPSGGAPHLLILVAGNHMTPFSLEKAARSGDGDSGQMMMADSEYLLDVAHRFGTYAQYTGSPNAAEVQYLEHYFLLHHFVVPMWGENAGNQGEPLELDQEVYANGLFGQEYIGSNLFESDHTTPSQQFFALEKAHAWLSNAWEGKAAPALRFDTLLIVQDGCLYADSTKRVSLCMQSDANLVLSLDGEAIWTSDVKQVQDAKCSTTGDPESECHCVFQGDGNLVISRGEHPLWASGTEQRGRHLVFLNRAPYLKILDAADSIIWAPVSIH